MEGAAGRSARSAVVVGGGVGGLSTAIRLKLSGQFDRVRILEKNDRLGGRVKTLKLESCTSSSTYRFDTGPSLLLFPEEYMRTFEELGCELPEMKPVGNVGYRCFFNRRGPRRPGQDTLDLLLEDDEMAAQLESVEEGAGEAYSRMIRAARTALEVGNGAFIDRNFATLAEFVNPLRFLPLLPRLVDGGILNPLSLLRPLDGWLRGYFRDPRIRALFTFQTLYVGLSPYTAPSAFSLLAATELTDGVYYPAGGFGEVALALEARARQVGVEVELAEEVEAVTTSSRGWVSGVRTKGGRGHDASVVVVNADLPWAQRNIAGLGEKGKTEVRGGGA
ncbi:phytoene desaturase [Chloropicon roscoffensis]|uniref:Phytoene desaturase n=3 Tax=Chloropicon roscoffensis TaxID=1461544 RepID=A0AAX4PKY8_9CHLO